MIAFSEYQLLLLCLSFHRFHLIDKCVILQLLNQIVCELPPEHPIASIKPLRDSLGHTPIQVISLVSANVYIYICLFTIVLWFIKSCLGLIYTVYCDCDHFGCADVVCRWLRELCWAVLLHFLWEVLVSWKGYSQLYCCLYHVKLSPLDTLKNRLFYYITVIIVCLAFC